jgi:hypothetical protein
MRARTHRHIDALTHMKSPTAQARVTSSFAKRGVSEDTVQLLRAHGVGMWSASEDKDLDKIVQDILWKGAHEQ